MIFFWAKTDDEGDFLRIVSYKKINDVTYEDIERVKKYYDCSCKVIIWGEFVVNHMETKVQICLFWNDGYSFSFLKLSPYYVRGVQEVLFWKIMIILYTCICRLAIKLINEISITRYVTTAGLECTTKTEILNINKRVFYD